MSATNETSTIGLSQYISTDKPTYLVDYNSDMLKIDNAIAADRGSIADVNVVAERADGKADTNKSSIDTLNEQINGDPLEPTDTGLAGKVNTLEGNVNTINSLIGNGAPTTSDQTLIGAVNALEGAIAPREDGDNLANSYAIGEQFARGGSVYSALTALTAGTAFASLTLNTDYKVSDTVVEQIADLSGEISGINPDATENPMTVQDITITADGVKTFQTLLNELRDATNTAIAAVTDGKFATAYLNIPNVGKCLPANGFVPATGIATGEYDSAIISAADNEATLRYVQLSTTDANTSAMRMKIKTDGTITLTDYTSVVPANGSLFIARIVRVL